MTGLKRLTRNWKMSLTILLAVCALTTVTTGQEGGSKTVHVDTAGTFEIHVQGADLRGVLQLLSTQGQKNIVATQDVAGQVTADLYGVTFQGALEAVLRSSGYVYEEKDGFIYVYTPEQLEAIHAAERKLVVRVFRLAYMTAEDMQELISPALSSEGTIAVTPASATGIEQSDSDAGGNSMATEDVIVVRDFEENIENITEIIASLDVKPQQVLIEATILRASLTENNDLGIDFESLAGINFSTLNATTTGFLTDVVPQTTTAVNGITPAGHIGTNLSSTVPTGGLSVGIITNQVAMFIRALEDVTDITVLANPKLLVLNKQRAEVMIGNRDGYITTTITETVATQTVEFLETGTRLLVRPYIGRNGYIRMEVHPEDSDGGVGANGLPSESTTETTTNIMVRDGHTIVIGGLFREKTTNGRAQVPLIANIPLIGELFRSTNDSTEREEVIILITPHIIKSDDDEATSEQYKDDIERFRVGQRKGLRWWSSSRLAQSHIRWAKQHLSAGDVDKATWDVDMALSIYPTFEEAISMKEQLTEEAYWSDEARVSSVRQLVQRLMMQEMHKPAETIISPLKPLHAEDVDPQVRKAFGIGKRYREPIFGPPKPAEIDSVQVEGK